MIFSEKNILTHRGTFMDINWFITLTPMFTKNAYLDLSDVKIFTYEVNYDPDEVNHLIPVIHEGCTYFKDSLPVDFETYGRFIGWDYAHANDICGFSVFSKWQLGQTIENFSISSFATKVSDEQVIQDIEEVIKYIVDNYTLSK